MKRSSVNLEQIARWHNLMVAFDLARRGGADGNAVKIFAQDLQRQISRLRHELLSETLQVGHYSTFNIRDPKPRIIHAPAFRERVLHHALMSHLGPVLDRALVHDTYACREGRGALAAVKRCQHHARRFKWYAQIDFSQYFANIDHGILIKLLTRKFKDPGVLRLLKKIVYAYETIPEKGLPIGALTSQHFANYYLTGFDRHLLEQCRVQGMVRYMDDVVWFGPDKTSVRHVLDSAQAYAGYHLDLRIKPSIKLDQSHRGILFCGYRVLPGALLLSRRRKRAYITGRRQWERAYTAGIITADQLQAAYSSVLSGTLHASAATWRREQLMRAPVAHAVEQL